MKGKGKVGLFFTFFLILATVACAGKLKPSVLSQEFASPPKAVLEIFAQEGKSDYFLFRDGGYALSLIYLCRNRVYNFIEDPGKNLILVSVQPILNSEVEKKIPAEDQIKIWACWKQKVREEQGRVEEQKNRIIEERIKLEKEAAVVLKTKSQIIAEIEIQKKLAEQKRRQIEENFHKLEEERLRKLEEEQRKKLEDERKIKVYKAAEKEKEEPPPPPPKITEAGIFLITKEADLFEEAKKTSKIHNKAKKFEILEVINSKKDENGTLWHQVVLGERVVSKKGKKIGWTPEEKVFWVKNKLLAWVYPGDITKINNIKPLRLNPEEIQFTGKKISQPPKPPFYEVIYELNIEYTEKIFGWVEDQNGIRRPDKNIDEMMDLLKHLALTLWPLRIQNDILRGNIRVGFNPEQVIMAWGRPNHVNKTRTFVGVHEQWVYGEKPFPHAYIYFENGLVKNWEFFKKSGK